MKKFLTIGMLALTAASATPAMAQQGRWHGNRPGDNYADGGQYASQIQSLGDRIMEANRNGDLSRRELNQLRTSQQGLESVFRRYSANGRINDWERRDLRTRITTMRDNIERAIREGGRGRYDRDGRDGRRDRDGRGYR